MKRGMTIEYLMCRADLNFEVVFGVNGAIGTIVTSEILLYSDNASFSSIKKKLKYAEFPFNSENSVFFGQILDKHSC